MTLSNIGAITPIPSFTTFLQGSLWPKVDWGGCRETEEPLCADEELEPRGSFHNNLKHSLRPPLPGGGGGGEAAGHPHHCEAAGGGGEDLREPRQDGTPAFRHRRQRRGSSETFPGELSGRDDVALIPR